eukprot:GILJ01012340.1.p1 GENE.GILJ01012340.1~~GILJ01012340.1.p1  ORF type:complete len:574 (-),score=57.10 GILJ01012340.1:66-1787(-)
MEPPVQRRRERSHLSRRSIVIDQCDVQVVVRTSNEPHGLTSDEDVRIVADESSSIPPAGGSDCRTENDASIGYTFEFLDGHIIVLPPGVSRDCKPVPKLYSPYQFCEKAAQSLLFDGMMYKKLLNPYSTILPLALNILIRYSEEEGDHRVAGFLISFIATIVFTFVMVLEFRQRAVLYYQLLDYRVVTDFNTIQPLASTRFWCSIFLTASVIWMVWSRATWSEVWAMATSLVFYVVLTYDVFGMAEGLVGLNKFLDAKTNSEGKALDRVVYIDEDVLRFHLWKLQEDFILQHPEGFKRWRSGGLFMDLSLLAWAIQEQKLDMHSTIKNSGVISFFGYLSNFAWMDRSPLSARYSADKWYGFMFASRGSFYPPASELLKMGSAVTSPVSFVSCLHIPWLGLLPAVERILPGRRRKFSFVMIKDDILLAFAHLRDPKPFAFLYLRQQLKQNKATASEPFRVQLQHTADPPHIPLHLSAGTSSLLIFFFDMETKQRWVSLLSQYAETKTLIGKQDVNEKVEPLPKILSADMESTLPSASSMTMSQEAVVVAGDIAKKGQNTVTVAELEEVECDSEI